MSDKSWKAWERDVAKKLGGKRRGPDFRGPDAGRDGVIHPVFATEVKLLSAIRWGDVLRALDQAKASHDGSKLPIAVLRRKHRSKTDAVVCIRLDDFAEWYGDG